MHLSQIYSRDLNVEVGNPIIQPHFFPLPAEKYITIHNSDKVPAKSYSYWPDVIKILKPELSKRDISIIQIGAKEDEKIDGVDQFINFTTFKQSFYLIKNSMLQLGIDSCPIHIASSFNIPTVGIYAHTYAATCDPLWNKDKAIVLESHRNGDKPTFSLNEDPKTIDILKAEEIAEACFKGLGIKEYQSQETLFIGKKYKSKIVDIIPAEMPSDFNFQDSEVRIRMDINFNEQVLSNIFPLLNTQVELITDRQINEDLINFYKTKISKIIYNAEKFDESFLKFLKHSGIDFELNCVNKENLSEQRVKFFNYDIALLEERKDAEKLKEENSHIIQVECKFYTGRVYILGEKKAMSLSQNQDDILFWVDAPYFRIYKDTFTNLQERV